MPAIQGVPEVEITAQGVTIGEDANTVGYDHRGAFR
jgi:hypothetical protein